MNYAIILAGGTGQRMKTSGMPKQFLSVFGKPIIIYTLETFENNPDIDEIVIPCNEKWIGKMKSIVRLYDITKAKKIIVGGVDRNHSILNGLNAIENKLTNDDVIVIHDGVRPLVKSETISENVTVAKEKGNAMTVKQNIETVVVTKEDTAKFADFMDRRFTYTLTAPQSFRAKELVEILLKMDQLNSESDTVPIIDVSIAYASLGIDVNLVIEEGMNLKITTSDDYYAFKAYLEAQENKNILGV